VAIDGQWKATITYELGDTTLTNQNLCADILLFKKGKKIGGSSVDRSGKAKGNDAGIISGSVENNHVNFILQYRDERFINKSGQLEISEDKPAADMIFSGHYNENDDTCYGTWETTILEYKPDKANIPVKLSGNWFLKRS